MGKRKSQKYPQPMRPEVYERKFGHVQHRKALMERDKMVCQLCGKKIKCYYDMSIDHIVARRFGGGNEIENLQLAHKECNARKGRLEALNKWNPTTKFK